MSGCNPTFESHTPETIRGFAITNNIINGSQEDWKVATVPFVYALIYIGDQIGRLASALGTEAKWSHERD